MPLLNEMLVAKLVDVRDNPGGSGYLFTATDSGRKVALDIESPVEVVLTTAHQAVISRVASYTWRRDGSPEKDSEPTSVGRAWYDDRAKEVVRALVELGFEIKAPVAAKREDMKRSGPRP